MKPGRLFPSLILKMVDLARMEASRRTDEQARRRTVMGTGGHTDFSRVSWKPNARLSLGDDVYFEGACIFERESAQVKIGSRTYFGGLISCAAEVEIGEDVLISQAGYIADHNSHAVDFEGRCHDVSDWIAGEKNWSGVEIAPVRIGDKAWIGYGVLILPGVTIGEGAVIGAGSVVTRSIEPFTVAAGNPAKPIRKLDAES
jgi:acyl-[acyl carrier protein]--UDP-N-acetylglucosamine O-acyltransferase